jgi:hypothetical protein
MRYLIVFCFSAYFVAISASAEVVSCECPELECDPCLEEQGVKFYSEKCGPQGARIRSCAKPTCTPKDPLPKGCDLSMLLPSEQKSKVGQKIAAAATQKKIEKAVERKLAEFKKEMRGPKVGSVHTAKGPSTLILSDGSQLKIKEGIEVHEKDTVETSLRGHVKILFDDGNVANIKPSSKLKLDQYEMGENKKAILKLIKGKVRSKVKQKYNDNKSSYFRVKTKSAVAVVRGTDFVVEHSEDQRIVTKVSTFEGLVKLKGKSAADEDAAEISAGNQASFIVLSIDQPEVFSDDEINSFIARGYMTPVYSLSKEELKLLNELTEVGEPVERHIGNASKRDANSVCSNPSADVNQCSWLCQNNPKGESRCRTDLPQVNCLRRRCDGNGNWTDENRLPANFFDRCQPHGHKVGPCDY